MTTLEDYLNTKSNSLIALSIFLLISIELIISKTNLATALALLSSVISYILMINIIEGTKKEDSLGLRLFKITLAIFVVVFCVWCVLNLDSFNTPLSSISSLILFLVGMIIPGFKIGKKNLNSKKK
jgi:amino acid transporter